MKNLTYKHISFNKTAGDIWKLFHFVKKNFFAYVITRPIIKLSESKTTKGVSTYYIIREGEGVSKILMLSMGDGEGVGQANEACVWQYIFLGEVGGGG